jgi:hypothetical protein
MNLINEHGRTKINRIKTAIVFGGASHDGKLICEDLVKKKYYTFCIDDLSSKNSKHPDFWGNSCKEDPRFIFFKEKWEDFIASEVCIETNIDLVIVLVTLEKSIFYDWMRTLTKPPCKVIFKTTNDITKSLMWEYFVSN